VRGYKREWLDQLTLSGEVTWGRLWGAGLSPVRRTPLCLLPREDLESWTALAGTLDTAADKPPLPPTAQEILDLLTEKGALFFKELLRNLRLPAASVEEGLAAAIAHGRVTCDSFGALRALLLPAWRRGDMAVAAGRWSPLQRAQPQAPDKAAEFAARHLLRRTGVVFRKTTAREKLPVPWRDIARACRRLEARGEIRGGRFVASFDGEQYALPEAVTMLRAVRRKAALEPTLVATVSAADPLNFAGILTPEERVAPLLRRLVRVG
jgi:ATP-dependent Lhr-like helicase